MKDRLKRSIGWMRAAWAGGLGEVRASRERASMRISGILAAVGLRPGEALLSTVILLVTLGTVMVMSASFFHRSIEGDRFFFLRRQLLWLPIAIFSGVLAARFDYRVLLRHYGWILLASALLLVLVYVPGIGIELNRARRWIRAGSLQFQPSELAKLAVIISIAGFLANDPERARLFFRGFLPSCAAIFAIVGLILMEPDFGTAIFILLLAGSLLLVAGMRKRYAILSALLAAPPIALFMVWRWEMIRRRLLGFISPEEIYQVKHSLIAFGAGSFWGSGLGAGAEKLKILPEPQTDFIFAVIGEELGFVGCVSVIALFLILLLSGAAIARRARDVFGFLLASGIIISLTLQAAINITVVTATGPTKGIPLPFITFGGSGLVMGLIQVGILLSISRLSETSPVPDGGAEITADPPASSPAPPARLGEGRTA